MLTPFCRCSTQQLVLSVRVCVWECAFVCVVYFFLALSLSLCLSSFAFWQLELSLAINTHTHTQVFRQAQHLSFNWCQLFIYLWLIYLFFVRLIFIFVFFFRFFFLFFCNMSAVKCVSFRLIATLDCFVSFRLVWFCYLIFFLSRCIALNRYTYLHSFLFYANR